MAEMTIRSSARSHLLMVWMRLISVQFFGFLYFQQLDDNGVEVYNQMTLFE